MKPEDDPNLVWAGPVCYFCDRPIRKGHGACEIEIEGEDGTHHAHRACVDQPEDVTELPSESELTQPRKVYH